MITLTMTQITSANPRADIFFRVKKKFVVCRKYFGSSLSPLRSRLLLRAAVVMTCEGAGCLAIHHVPGTWSGIGPEGVGDDRWVTIEEEEEGVISSNSTVWKAC